MSTTTQSNQFISTDLDLPLPSFNSLHSTDANDYDYSTLLSSAGLGIPSFDSDKIDKSSAEHNSDTHEQWLKDSNLDISQLNLPIKLSRSTTQGVAETSNRPTNTSKHPIVVSEADSTVKPVPAWVERHTSFKSHSSPATILQRCSAALLQSHADFVTNQKKHKIKGVAYVNGSIVHFVCRVYSNTTSREHLSPPRPSSDQPDYIVEFQKRSGCAMAFNSLYRDIIAQITDIYSSNIDGDSSLPPLTSLSRTISQADDSDNDAGNNSSTPSSPLRAPRKQRAYTEQFGLTHGVSRMNIVQPQKLPQQQPSNSNNKLDTVNDLSPNSPSLQAAQADIDAIVAGANESLLPPDQYDGHDDDILGGVPEYDAQKYNKRSCVDSGLLPSEGNQNLSVTQLGDHTLCSLLSMALSDDGCSAREAISALAGLPASVIVHAIGENACSGDCDNLSMHGLVNALCRALEGGDSALTRSAAVLLANMSEEPAFAEHLLDKDADSHVHINNTSDSHTIDTTESQKDHANLVDQVFTLLNFPTCFSAKCRKTSGDCGYTNRFPALILRDIKRQVAKALANITLVQPKQMLELMMQASRTSKIDYKNVLQRYKVSPCADPRLQRYVEIAIDRIGELSEVIGSDDNKSINQGTVLQNQQSTTTAQ